MQVRRGSATVSEGASLRMPLGRRRPGKAKRPRARRARSLRARRPTRGTTRRCLLSEKGVSTHVPAAVVPGCSPRDALRIGWSQHAVFPSPNSGWPEAAAAGGIRRRLLGPIFAGGALVTDLWLGDPSHPEARSAEDHARARALVTTCGLLAGSLGVVVLALR